MTPINPDNLIPPDSELAHLLAQWSEDEDTRTWNIANLTNELIVELEGAAITKKDVYRAVAKRCKGRKPNTIRRIAEVAADYSPEIQEQYAQLLSFEHFKLSRRLFAEGITPSIDYALQWCIEGNDMKLNAGKFHTVGDMLHHFLPDESFKNDLVGYWEKSKEKLYDLILIHENDVERHKMKMAWSDMDNVISRLDKKPDIGYHKEDMEVL